MVNPPRGESREPGFWLERPDGPPVAPALDAGTYAQRAEQAARADVAARAYDVDTILGPGFEFAHAARIAADAAVRRDEAAVFVDEAQLSGDRLVRTFEDGTNADLADSPYAGRTVEQLTEDLVLAEQELARESGELERHERMLAGDATDESGAVLTANVPRTTAAKYARRRFLDLALFAPFEIVFAYFVYRLTVGSTPGANQVLMETIETVSIVAIALLTQLLMPPLIAHGIAMLRRFDPAADTRAGAVGRWLKLAVPGTGVVLLITLAASLRGAYLASLQSDQAALGIAPEWFVLFAIVLLAMPMVVVVLISLRKNYWNAHIDEVLVRRPVVAALARDAAALRAELDRRDRLVQTQESVTASVVGNWADEVLSGIPAKAAGALASYAEVYVREAGDPAVSDAVAVALASERARLGAWTAAQDARLEQRLSEHRKDAHRSAQMRAGLRAERAEARHRSSAGAPSTGSTRSGPRISDPVEPVRDGSGAAP